MTAPRSSELYCQPRTLRALKAIAEAYDATTADGLADLWLTERIAADFPALIPALDQVDEDWKAFIKSQKKKLSEALVKTTEMPPCPTGPN